MILNIFENIKREERIKIEELKLKLNEEKYMIYEIELYINFKRKKLKNILNCEYILRYDKKRMKILKDLSEWIYIDKSEIFNDEMIKKKKKKK